MVENEDSWRQEWSCSGWVPGLDEDLVTEVGWQGERWEQKGAEEMMAGGVELQLLGEGRGSMCTDTKWKQKLVQARQEEQWGLLDVYSDGGADGVGTPEAAAEYDWLVGGTGERSLGI